MCLKAIRLLIFCALASTTIQDPTRESSSDHHTYYARPKDCADRYMAGDYRSGIYKIWPTWFKNQTGFQVYCDMETADGGWTVIHRWGNYSFPEDYFRRTWADYKNGFGDLETAFWLGNEMIFALTSQGAYELRFDMEGTTGSAFSVYKSFWIEQKSQCYKLHLGNYNREESGTTSSPRDMGDIFGNHRNALFSTFDVINYDKRYQDLECTEIRAFRSAWWFSRECTLNKEFYLSFADPTNKENLFFRNEMKIRPVSFQKMMESA